MSGSTGRHRQQLGITLVVPKLHPQHGGTLTLCQFNEVNAHDIDGFLARDLIA
ncbi:MAG: hypothetical protein R3A10_10615 [Caldilineaceae bacterium]